MLSHTYVYVHTHTSYALPMYVRVYVVCRIFNPIDDLYFQLTKIFTYSAFVSQFVGLLFTLSATLYKVPYTILFLRSYYKH